MATKQANPFGTPKQSRPTLNELINKPMMEQQQMTAGGGTVGHSICV